ncbi:MAG: SGNH/GDSL hydrolase family protein [Nanoarchaeota archaeon]|nr:SGNH/GDSL hydrolase family protein [Nanoarchaeota archaeon]
MQLTNKNKKLLINLILLLIVSIILFVMLEILFRFIYGPGRIQDEKGNTPYISDNSLGFKLKPNYVGGFKEIDFDTQFTTNSQGFRSAYDFSQQDKDVIFMLGDSFTAGSGVEINESIAFQLEKIFMGEFKIYNLGVPGYSQMQQVKQLESMLPLYSPDLIILNFYSGNDVSDNCNYSPTIQQEEGLYGRAKVIFKKSQFITALYRKIIVPLKYPANLDYYLDQENVQECYNITKDYLKEIKMLADLYDLKLIMTVIPREQQTVEKGRKKLIDWYDNFEEYDENKFDLDIVKRKVLDMCHELEIECFDLTPIFIEKDGEVDLYVNDGHWNEEGHKLAAQSIAKYLKNENYLD